LHLVRPLLAKYTRSFDRQTFQKGSAALSRAVTLSHEKVFDVLLEAGFSPYTGRYNGPFSADVLPYGSPFRLAMSARELTYLKKFLNLPLYDFNKKQRLERLRQLTAAYVSEMVAFPLDAGADIKGQYNTKYRRTVYRAQRNGHVSVAALLHEWKTSQYSGQDCDTIDNIMGSMTSDELDFPWREEAKATHLRDRADVYLTLKDHTTECKHVWSLYKQKWLVKHQQLHKLLFINTPRSLAYGIVP
jgi:hypothetical protein